MYIRVLLLALMLFSSPALSEDAPPGTGRVVAPGAVAGPLLPGQATIDLMRSCQGKGSFYDLAVEGGGNVGFYGDLDLVQCNTYISGIVDMNAEAQNIMGLVAFCPPPPNPLRQSTLRRAFLRWTRAHPELLHESRQSGVIAAFREAFPCRSPTPRHG